MIEEAPVETVETPVRYVNAGVSLNPGGGESKSVISQSAEAFNSAVLYAMNPQTGEILLYGSNAGNLNGTPVYIQTSEKTFAWPLPVNVPIRIYCIINPPASFLSGVSATGLTEGILSGAVFLCSGPEQLRLLDSDATGLPMAGVLDIQAGEITEDDASVSIPVKNLFAKYRVSIDLSSLESGESLTVTNLSVNKGNTSLPYFSEDFRQDSDALLKDFDYATREQLAALSKGGDSGGVEVYVLENCHGTRTGARHWWTVYRDLYSSWPEISKCTCIQLCYYITGADGTVNSYNSRIFLGSGNMADNFDVRRNLYKSITVRANRRTGDSDPYLDFPAETVYIAPGTERSMHYSSNVYSVTQDASKPEIWFTDSAGLETDLFSVTGHDNSAGELRIRAGAEGVPGTEYWLCGGIRNPFYWPPYGTSSQSFTQMRRIVLVQSRTLTFDAPAEEVYPYQTVSYLSRERFSLAAARELLSSVRLTSVADSADPSYTQVSAQAVDQEYAIRVTLVPSRPGTIGFTAAYGETSTETVAPAVTVYEPTLKASGDTHINVNGSRATVTWRLMDKDGASQLPAPIRGTMTLSKRDPYGTELTVQSSVSGTSCTGTLYLAGFSGLPGFNVEDYTFGGISIPVECSFTYPGGYALSTAVNAIVDNPLAGYSYYPRTYEYSVLQGKSEQPSFVTVDPGSYKVENMIQWPVRRFEVDISRSGTVACNGLEKWTEYSGINSVVPYTVNNWKVFFYEDLSAWGPLYLGRMVTNSESGETVKFIHSIIRLYSHYNVFAKFDAQEKNHVRIDWDDQGSIDWSPFLMIMNYHFGSFQARLVSNIAQSPYPDAIGALLKTDIAASTKPKPILSGFTLQSGKLSGHGTYTAGLHSTYQLYGAVSNGSYKSYMLGYYSLPTGIGYDINYDWIYYDGSDDNNDYIYWRMIAACNKPWFKIGNGGVTLSGKYVTRVQKNAAGDYCFNVLDSSANQSYYLDGEGMGYLRLCPWWEGKEGRVSVSSRDLHPLTSYDAPLMIVNGWYDPSPYSGGIPVLNEKVGMYFFPQSATVNTRSGYPAYYTNDWPYPESSSRGTMEISGSTHLSFGDLYRRDASAPR